MSILVVGSVALDTVETPFGSANDALGGSAIYFSAAASYFAPVNLVAVVGDDFQKQQLDFLAERNVDLQGLEVKPGKTFRWGGKYGYDLNDRETLFTHLNV
ncbi:sugar kinase, partial [bacterium]|nr:sugar kinase [bacterium]